MAGDEGGIHRPRSGVLADAPLPFAFRQDGEQRTPGAEAASGDLVRRARQVTREQHPLPGPFDLRIGHRDRRHQRPRVRVARMAIELVGLTVFDDPAEIHHGHEVGYLADDGEIVGDEEIGQAEAVAQVLEQVDDTGLNGHVEGGDRLIEDQQLWVRHQRPGDADPLPLTSGELVRIAFGHRGVEPDEFEHLGHLVIAFGGGDSVHGQGFGDDFAHRQARIDGGHRVLEHDLDVFAHGQAFARVEIGDVDAVDDDPPLLRGDHFEHFPDRRRLAAARRAAEPERVSGLDLEIDSVDGPNGADLPFEHGALEQWEVLLQAGDFENVRGTVVSYAGGDRFGARVDVLGGQIAAGDLPGPVAGGLDSLDAGFDEFGVDLAAGIDGDRTAWGEWASWSQIRQ